MWESRGRGDGEEKRVGENRAERVGKIEGGAQRKQNSGSRDGEREIVTERSLWKISKVDIKCRPLLERQAGLWFLLPQRLG